MVYFIGFFSVFGNALGYFLASHLFLCSLGCKGFAFAMFCSVTIVVHIFVHIKMVFLFEVIDNFYYYFAIDILVNQWLPF